MKKNEIIIYTDGAARGNPGPAGWGAVILFSPSQTSPKGRSSGKIIEIGGRENKATNNQMELSGPIGALKFLKKHKAKEEVHIFSDSKYVIHGITEWIFNWQKNNWRNAAKKPVLNKELWQELFELTQNFKIKWTYVEGHSGIEHNERADIIATSFADNNPVI
jgi:ribonuclease HI